MSTLRISDAPLLPDVDGTEKIPTGGRGDYAISVDQIKDHIFEDIGKELVGLGNVDNTSDLDKPVSTAQQAALNLKADKTYVDTNLNLKADKTNVYTRSETTLALSTKADLVNGTVPSNQLPSYVDDVVEYTTSTLPIIGESGKIYITTDTNRTWRWSGNQYVEISNGGISDSTLKLQTPRKIANVDFDGTQNINIPHNNLTDRDAIGAHPAIAISYGSISQETYNSGVETIAEMLAIQNPLNGMRVYVKSHSNPVWGLLNQLGSGDFVYVSALASQNNGVTVFNGWVRLQQNAEINVTWAGAIGDGTHDDTDAFNIAKEVAMKMGGGVYIPAPRDHYKITSTITFNEKIHFRGDGGTMIDSWHGKVSQGGSRVKFYGTGAAFYLDPILAPTSEQRPAYGVMFKDLIIEGTDAATHGIKVSDESLINVAGADIGSFNIDNVYLINFKHGRGLELNFCFMNTIRNMFTGDCAVGATLRYAHNTTFLGGSFQQGLLGLDATHSYDVNLHGTCLQGHHPDRATLLGLQMPSDFFVWQGGWDGTGADGVTRNTPADYAGVGCRVFGSIVSWFGGYEEYNEVGYITELGSTLRLYSKYVDLDAMSKYWLQIGIGSLTVDSPKFAQGQHTKLKGVIHTERNYAAPINITAPEFPATLPVAKQYTGYTTSSPGVVDVWNPNTFRFKRQLFNADVDVHGVIQHKGSHCTDGFNKEFREIISPATTTSRTLDMAVGTTGVNFSHLANGVNITVDFNDTNRAQVGVTMKIVLINNHATDVTTIIFSDKFKTGSPNYVLDKQKQRVFEFYFENGAWLEVGVPLTL